MSGAPDIRDLGPHDPLPDLPSVTVLRRLAEDDPDRAVVEIVVVGSAGPALDDAGAAPADWDAATRVAQRIAVAAGLDCVWRIDRTAGALERVVLDHHGDHAASGVALIDDDAEEGEHGADMRDVGRPARSTAPE